LNIVHTAVHISGEEKDLENFKAAVKKDGTFSFEKIIPMPKGVAKEELRSQESNWFIENWSSFGEPFNREIEQPNKNFLNIYFDTKAGFPGLIYLTMVQKFPSIYFQVFASEELGNFEYRGYGDSLERISPSGWMQKIIDEQDIEEESEEHPNTFSGDDIDF